MRFPQVKIGQRFTFQNEIYTKTGPVTASREGSGDQRMIMRSAEVSLLDEAGKAVPSSKQRYSRTEMEAGLTRLKSNLAAAAISAADEDGSLSLEVVLNLIESAEFSD
jgi:hypothetical protein